MHVAFVPSSLMSRRVWIRRDHLVCNIRGKSFYGGYRVRSGEDETALVWPKRGREAGQRAGRQCVAVCCAFFFLFVDPYLARSYSRTSAFSSCLENILIGDLCDHGARNHLSININILKCLICGMIHPDIFHLQQCIGSNNLALRNIYIQSARALEL